MFCLQAYSTVVSAAEGDGSDPDGFGKVDEVKQYLFLFYIHELLQITTFFYSGVLGPVWRKKRVHFPPKDLKKC